MRERRRLFPRVAQKWGKITMPVFSAVGVKVYLRAPWRLLLSSIPLAKAAVYFEGAVLCRVTFSKHGAAPSGRDALTMPTKQPFGALDVNTDTQKTRRKPLGETAKKDRLERAQRK